MPFKKIHPSFYFMTFISNSGQMFKGKKNKINPINNCTVNVNAGVNLLKRKVEKKNNT